MCELDVLIASGEISPPSPRGCYSIMIVQNYQMWFCPCSFQTCQQWQVKVHALFTLSTPKGHIQLKGIAFSYSLWLKQARTMSCTIMLSFCAHADITNQLWNPFPLRPVIASKISSTHKAPKSQQGLTRVGISTRNKSYLPNSSRSFKSRFYHFLQTWFQNSVPITQLHWPHLKYL